MNMALNRFWYFMLFSLFSLFSSNGFAQVSVYPVQELKFGIFSRLSSGGTVEVAPNGSRSATGDIVLLYIKEAAQPAIFEIEAPVGTVISVTAPEVTLTGSNGGSLKLRLAGVDRGNPFVTDAAPPLRNTVRIGAVLTVGTASESPVGNYSGSYSITFSYE